MKPADILAFDAAAFQARMNVSRETLDKLTHYVAALTKWQKQINLISPTTVPEIWWRHVYDSAQLWPLLPQEQGPLVDLGSGAGFPALVLAIMGAPQIDHVHMVESNGKKCAFLRQIARDLDLAVTVHNSRIEAVPPFLARVVTSRALASLDKLLDYADAFLGPETVCLLPKGRNAGAEVDVALQDWKFDLVKIPSQTDPDGVILKLINIQRR